MPSELPNENMDKALKAYAQKRRDDSPQIEMDLAARNMLQAEVKRTLGEVPVPAPTRSRPRFAWWPQMLIGVASAAALAIAVLFWKLPSRNEGTGSVVEGENRSIAAADTTIAPSKAEPETDTFKKDVNREVPASTPAATPAPVLADEQSKPAKDLSGGQDLAKSVERRDEEKSAEIPMAKNSAVATDGPTESTLTAAPASVGGTPLIGSTAPSGTVLQSPPLASAAPAVAPETPKRSFGLAESAPELSTRLAVKSENAYFDRKQDVPQQPQQQQKIR
ncbi:MAG: hypothetical protein JWO95_1045, partial [Verrucomicrobiales bacterium]|nr:hypothetical protein [Verrucomicrobiales bacterium]